MGEQTKSKQDAERALQKKFESGHPGCYNEVCEGTIFPDIGDKVSYGENTGEIINLPGGDQMYTIRLENDEEVELELVQFHVERDFDVILARQPLCTRQHPFANCQGPWNKHLL